MGVIEKVGEKEWEKESVKRENGRERESERERGECSSFQNHIKFNGVGRNEILKGH